MRGQAASEVDIETIGNKTNLSFFGFFVIGSSRQHRLVQIFNDLDVQDDKLMLDLAVFLNRLVSVGTFTQSRVQPPQGSEGVRRASALIFVVLSSKEHAITSHLRAALRELPRCLKLLSNPVASRYVSRSSLEIDLVSNPGNITSSHEKQE